MEEDEGNFNSRNLFFVLLFFYPPSPSLLPLNALNNNTIVLEYQYLPPLPVPVPLPVMVQG